MRKIREVDRSGFELEIRPWFRRILLIGKDLGILHSRKKLDLFLLCIAMLFKFLAEYMDSSYVTLWHSNPAGIYKRKVNKRNTRTRCEICSKKYVQKNISHLLFVSYFLMFSWYSSIVRNDFRRKVKMYYSWSKFRSSHVLHTFCSQIITG